MNSSTEEDYLKSIYKLSSRGDSVATNAIAENLKTKASSVTDMIKKLSEKKLVKYIKYQGVKLSPEGEKIALKVIRKHRLWESFLVSKLNFNWDEIHEIAEQLEHINSPILIDKLDEHLGFPKFDPHGDPIPDKNGNFQKQNECALSKLNIHDNAILVGVKEHSSEFLKYLESIPLLLGAKIQILDFFQFDKSMKIKINGKTELMISQAIANNLNVTKS